MVPPVVTWEAIQAWERLTRVGPLEPWETEALVQLGMLRASIISERQQQQPKPSGGKGKKR